MASEIQLKSGESVIVRAPAATGAPREVQLQAGKSVTIHAPAADTPPWWTCATRCRSTSNPTIRG
jgi:hypothetical protein